MFISTFVGTITCIGLSWTLLPMSSIEIKANLFVSEGPGAAERRADGLAPLEGDGRDGPDAAQPGARSESGKELAP